MSNDIFHMLENDCQKLRLNLSAEEIASIATEQDFNEAALSAFKFLLDHVIEKKRRITVNTLLRLSRLPLRNAKTFNNFDFSAIHGKETERLKNLETLSPLYAHKNVILVGPAGTGKTHLAQAFGYACCQQGFKAYFIKMTELRDRMITARSTGKTSRLMNSLVRPSCLIIDEVGHCQFDKENTQLFFDLVDRRYNKEGNFNMVFTSNKMPSEWNTNFSESDSLLCALDRIFDQAIVFTLRGSSFRGQKREIIDLETRRTRSIK